MKKWISLLLGSFGAFAAAEDAAEGEAFTGCGVAFLLPEGMQNLEGTLLPLNTSVLDDIRCVDFLYFAMPAQRLAELEQKVIGEQTATPEEIQEYFDAGCSVCAVYCVGGGQDFGAVIDAYKQALDSDLGLKTENAVKLAQIGDYSFYLHRAHQTAEGTTLDGGAYADEYARVLACQKRPLRNLRKRPQKRPSWSLLKHPRKSPRKNPWKHPWKHPPRNLRKYPL